MQANQPRSFKNFVCKRNTANTMHSPSIHTFHHTSIHLFTHPSKLRSHLNTQKSIWCDPKSSKITNCQENKAYETTFENIFTTRFKHGVHETSFSPWVTTPFHQSNPPGPWPRYLAQNGLMLNEAAQQCDLQVEKCCRVTTPPISLGNIQPFRVETKSMKSWHCGDFLPRAIWLKKVGILSARTW